MSTRRETTAEAERPVDRLARQVWLLLNGVETAGGELSARERVAGAVRSILDRSMAQVGRVQPGLSPDTEMTPWTNPLELGAAYESLLMLRPRIVGGELRLSPTKSGGHERKKKGAYYTPGWLVELVLDAALDPVMEGRTEAELLNLRVMDPACGSGLFLVAAAQRLALRLAKARGRVDADARDRTDASRCVFGMDTDPVAVDVCRAAIWMLGGDDAVPSRVIVADGLLDAPPGVERDERLFDVVVGNPPFLNRLEKRTAVKGAVSERMKRTFQGAARAYTDVSALFLLRAVRLIHTGGRAALVQPQSVLSSRDAVGVRAELLKVAVLESLWAAEEHHFDASVFVCVPTFCKTGEAQGAVRRRMGGQNRLLAPVTLAEAGTGDSWGELGIGDVPDVSVADLSRCPTVGDLADVAADFRDEYYGLRGLIVEDSELGEADRHLFPKLITTGLVDPARCLWGVVDCRFAGQRWKAPRVDLARLRATTDLGRWAGLRLRSKLVLATQTRVLEVAVDEAGQWLPVTPLISIVPHKPGDLWRLGAALTSPLVTALGARRSAGSALTRDAIKLSATQVRALPVMPKNEAGGRAADLFREACGTTDRASLLGRAAEESGKAYGLEPAKSEELVQWWTERLQRRPQRD